jgi:hypothetical protein
MDPRQFLLMFTYEADRIWYPTHVSFETSNVRPDHVRIDHRGGIQLWYMPPVLAWSTRILPRYSGSTPAPPHYRAVDQHMYIVAIEVTSETGLPTARLYRGLEREPVDIAVKPGPGSP